MTPRAEHVVRQRLGELVADLLVDLGQHLEVEVGAQRLDEADALLRLEHLDEIGEVGALDVRYQRTHLARYRSSSSASATARTSSAVVAASRLMRANLLGLGHVQAHSGGGGRRRAPPGMTIFASRA